MEDFLNLCFQRATRALAEIWREFAGFSLAMWRFFFGEVDLRFFFGEAKVDLGLWNGGNWNFGWRVCGWTVSGMSFGSEEGGGDSESVDTADEENKERMEIVGAFMEIVYSHRRRFTNTPSKSELNLCTNMSPHHIVMGYIIDRVLR